MLQLSNPAWWYTLASVVLGAFGVQDAHIQADVRSVIAGVVGIVVAVYTHEHHATLRNADTAAASIRAAASSPAPLVVSPTAAPAKTPAPTSGQVVAGVQTAPAVPPQADHVAL